MSNTLFTQKKDEARFSNLFYDDHYVHPNDIFEAIFDVHHGFLWSHKSGSTTTNMHSSHTDLFNYSNGSKLVHHYSDHAT
jgi:hypothetical protein